IVDKTPFLVPLFRRQHIIRRAVLHFGRLIPVQNDGAHAVYEPVARAGNTMIEHKPAFRRLDRGRSAADFHRLPPALPALGHDMAMLAPIHKIRAFTKEYVAKWR